MKTGKRGEEFMNGSKMEERRKGSEKGRGKVASRMGKRYVDFI